MDGPWPHCVRSIRSTSYTITPSSQLAKRRKEIQSFRLLAMKQGNHNTGSGPSRFSSLTRAESVTLKARFSSPSLPQSDPSIAGTTHLAQGPRDDPYAPGPSIVLLFTPATRHYPFNFLQVLCVVPRSSARITGWPFKGTAPSRQCSLPR